MGARKHPSRVRRAHHPHPRRRRKAGQGAGATLATSWSYLPNSGDRRLTGISNVGLTSGQYSTYAFTTSPIDQIAGVTETSDAGAVYPAAGQQSAGYNALNQITTLSAQAYSYDADGNLLSDGQRTYSWDAENRLIAIAYPGQAGKATTFTYDGLSRRTLITSTPAGGGTAVATAYVWCGAAICQARTAAGAVSKEYFSEGELAPGATAQPYYYGIDQIGSVRRVFASASSAPAYNYGPYGVPLQSTAPVTDIGYAGLFYNADSGLYLTNYRAYDPTSGRWLSRDPLGEAADPSSNLYTYVGGDPPNRRDPLGLWTVNISLAGSINIPLIGPLGLGVGGFGGIVCDGNQCAWYYGGGGGPGGGAGGLIGMQIGGSNANTACDLRGPFASGSVSGGEGLIVGGEGYAGSGIAGGNLFVGGGVGSPISGTVGGTYTVVRPW